MRDGSEGRTPVQEPRTFTIAPTRKRSCARESSGVLVIKVSQRSKAIALSIIQDRTFNISIQLYPSAKSVVVAVVELQTRLGPLPAVVAAAGVEVDQPESLHFDVEVDVRRGPP